MAITTLMRAQQRYEKAVARHNRVALKLYTLLGWGTAQEVEAAKQRVAYAREDVRRAEAAVARALGSPE